MIAYKFLDEGGVAPFSGFRWSLGDWVEARGVDPCRVGVHACRVRDLPIWLGRRLWEIELDGELVEREWQVVAQRGRLIRRLEEWNDDLLDGFGRLCVQRTRERVGFLPVLSGFVADVERFVAEGRFPIAGFAAARAAELRDGPAAYEEERAAQAAWLGGQLQLRPALG